MPFTSQRAIAPYVPPAAPQSQMLAQALASMRAGQPVTPIGLTANLVANAIDTFGQQAAGQGGADQWFGADGKASGNWFDSPLGQRIGGLFGLGRAAQSQPAAAAQDDGE